MFEKFPSCGLNGVSPTLGEMFDFCIETRIKCEDRLAEVHSKRETTRDQHEKGELREREVSLLALWTELREIDALLISKEGRDLK